MNLSWRLSAYPLHGSGTARNTVYTLSCVGIDNDRIGNTYLLIRDTGYLISNSSTPLLRLTGIGKSRTPSFSLHIHDAPEVATLAVILCTRIASPPVSICFAIMPIFHIRSKDHRDAAFTPGRTLWVKVRTIKSKSDIDAAIRGFGVGGWARRMWVKRCVQIKSRLRWNRVLERFLTFCVHYCQLEMRPRHLIRVRLSNIRCNVRSCGARGY